MLKLLFLSCVLLAVNGKKDKAWKKDKFKDWDKSTRKQNKADKLAANENTEFCQALDENACKLSFDKCKWKDGKDSAKMKKWKYQEKAATCQPRVFCSEYATEELCLTTWKCKWMEDSEFCETKECHEIGASSCVNYDRCKLDETGTSCVDRDCADADKADTCKKLKENSCRWSHTMNYCTEDCHVYNQDKDHCMSAPFTCTWSRKRNECYNCKTHSAAEDANDKQTAKAQKTCNREGHCAWEAETGKCKTKKCPEYTPDDDQTKAGKAKNLCKDAEGCAWFNDDTFSNVCAGCDELNTMFTDEKIRKKKCKKMKVCEWEKTTSTCSYPMDEADDAY